MPLTRMLGAIATLAIVASGAARADGTFQYIHSYFGGPGGAFPGPVVGHQTSSDPASWALYGFAFGNNSGPPLLYKLSPPSSSGTSWTETRLRVLPGYTVGSYGGTVNFDPAGAIYTVAADSNQCVSIIRLAPSSSSYFWQLTTIYDTCTVGRPFLASNIAIDASGAVYAISPAFLNLGQPELLLRLTPPVSGHGAWTETVIHSYPPTVSIGTLVFGPSGDLYTTEQVYNSGVATVDRLSPPAAGGTLWTDSTLFSFDAGYQSALDAVLPDVSGSLFLSGQFRAASGPVIYNKVVRLDPPVTGQTAWTETDIFTSPAGTQDIPITSLARFSRSGPIFGTIPFIPQVPGQSGTGGEVFRLDPPAPGSTAWTESTVVLFNDLQGSTNGPLVSDPAGSLYTTNEFGSSPYNGHDSMGTIVKIVP